MKSPFRSSPRTPNLPPEGDYPMREITPVSMTSSRENFPPYFMSRVFEGILKDSPSLPKAYRGGT